MRARSVPWLVHPRVPAVARSLPPHPPRPGLRPPTDRGADGPPVRGSTSSAEIIIDVSLQYKLRQVDLISLYRRYRQQYHSRLVSIALSALQEGITTRQVQDFYNARQAVALALRTTVTTQLNEHFVDVVGFQLRRVELPAATNGEIVNTAVQAEVCARASRSAGAGWVGWRLRLLVAVPSSSRLAAPLSAPAALAHANQRAGALERAGQDQRDPGPGGRGRDGAASGADRRRAAHPPVQPRQRCARDGSHVRHAPAGDLHLLRALPPATSIRLRAEEKAFEGAKVGLSLANSELLRYIYLQSLAAPTAASRLLVGFDKPILSIA